MYSSNIFLFLCITLLLQRETFHWLLKMRDSDEELLVQATIKLNQLLFFFVFLFSLLLLFLVRASQLLHWLRLIYYLY